MIMDPQTRATSNLRTYFAQLDAGGLATHARALALECCSRGLPGDAKLFEVAYQLSRHSAAEAATPALHAS